MANWSINSQLTTIFFPDFIPFGFIIFYCSVVLTIKRVRSALDHDYHLGVILGLFSFIALKSILSIPILIMFVQGQYKNYSSSLASNPMHFVICFAAFFLLGLSTVILLAFMKPVKQVDASPNIKLTFSFNGTLTDTDYAAHMGFLYALSFLTGIVFGILVSVCAWLNVLDKEIIWFFSGLLIISSILLSLCYIAISMKRIRSTGLKGRWVPIILFSYLVLMTGAATWQHFSNSETIVFGLSTFIIFLAISLWAQQFLLFILPAKSS